MPRLIEKMGQSMSHFDWHVNESYISNDQTIGIGRIGIGVFNQEQQPIWNADHSVALVIAGEIHNIDMLRSTKATVSSEHILLDLYEAEGLEFISRLDGAFVLAIWDQREHRLLLGSDRFATYPLFYAFRSGHLIFAPEVKALLSDDTLDPELDLTAVAQYVRFQQVLGERTFFKHIQMLAPATLLVFDFVHGSLLAHRYWSFAEIPFQFNISFNEAVEEAGPLLRRAVKRSTQGSYRPGVYLSGGLDSRTILGLTERRPLVTVTYGAGNCRDVAYAEQLAHVAKSNHYWFDFPNGLWVKEYAPLHLQLTEGYHSWIHSHGISTLSRMRELIDINISGWDGGTVMAYQESPNYYHHDYVDDTARAVALFQFFTSKHTWPGLTEAEERSLYQPDLWPTMNGLAFESFCEELAKYGDVRPDVRGEVFYLRNHCGRLTQNLITFYRAYMEVRYPFFDYALVDFMYSLHAPMRRDCHLYRHVIQRETPAMANVPWDDDGYLPTVNRLVHNTHKYATKARRRIGRYFPAMADKRTTLYADYEHYLRNELRDWAEGILLTSQALNRGMFRESSVRSLLARHMRGDELWTIGKIAPLMTLEMVWREFMD